MDAHKDTRLRDIVFEAIDELNEQLPRERRLAKDAGTPLAGADGHLDSLGVVNLIAVLEQKLEERFGTTVNLIDRGLLEDSEPLRSVGTLIDFLRPALNEGAHV
jgi:acyl carrier protein